MKLELHEHFYKEVKDRETLKKEKRLKLINRVKCITIPVVICVWIAAVFYLFTNSIHEAARLNTLIKVK